MESLVPSTKELLVKYGFVSVEPFGETNKLVITVKCDSVAMGRVVYTIWNLRSTLPELGLRDMSWAVA